jgi:hypothetical protein
MKRAGVISTAVLFLLLGTTARAYAQHEQDGKEQGKSRQEQQHQQGQRAQQQHQQQATRPVQRQEKPQSAYGRPYHGGVQPNGPTYGGVHHSGVPQHQEQVRGGFGVNLAPSRGMTNTGPGASAAAITATACLKTVSGAIGGATTTSASIAFR